MHQEAKPVEFWGFWLFSSTWGLVESERDNDREGKTSRFKDTLQECGFWKEAEL